MQRRCFLIGSAATATIWSRSALAETKPLRMRDLYKADLSFSDLALELEGQRVEMTGYMAPPLKADSKFFVLTKRPMAVCPFCETEAEWPDDILAIYSQRTLKVHSFSTGFWCAAFSSSDR